jgi:hypothetical protein
MSPVNRTDNGLGLPIASRVDEAPIRTVESVIEPGEEINYVVYFINDSNLGQSPILELKVENKLIIKAVIDSGSEISLISYDVYDKLIKAGTRLLVLPVEGVVLVTAFGKKSDRIKTQVYLEFTIGTDRFEHVFMVSSQLRNEAIIGCEFMKEFGVCIDFRKGTIRYDREGELKEREFVTSVETPNNESEGSKVKAVVLSNPPHPKSAESVDPELKGMDNSCFNPAHTQHRAVVKGKRNHDSSDLNMFPERTFNSSGGDDLELYGTECDHFICKEAPGIKISEMLEGQSRGSDGLVVVGEVSLRANSILEDLPGAEPNTHSENSPPDPRAFSKEDVYNIGKQISCLNSTQRQKLSSVLLRYVEFLTTKPGRCSLMKYKFQIVADQPIVGFSRPIPFAQRPAVRALINQMMSDGILEISNSHILNPLTIVDKGEGKIRMCVDARKVNQVTVPDYERAPPIQELLQKFNGAKYLTSLDLSAAFHQVQLDEESRPYTAFLFDSTVYQFTRIPYGFKNSLPAFIRAIKLALGGSNQANVVHYVDDVLIYSETFDEHMMHLDAVLAKLTKAGFTINAKKCRFCKEEVKFLGHRIDRTGVSADPERIAAILHYPAPRNARQLRQFLGTCNFHSRFIAGYANYVAPLTPLLKQGVKWKWSQESQDAFLKLRGSFANSIYLIHPREDLPYAIYTDASKLGISSILTQVNESGENLVVSTASRILTQVERRYSTCEQELLAVTYALQKFRIYVVGHQITVYSDNKALSFLKKCNLTSARVTRWIMQLQEYDLKIEHISGTHNHFADILSRNPIGLSQESRDQALKPHEVNVRKVNLGTDKTLMKELGSLSVHQRGDPILAKIRDELVKHPLKLKEKYKIHDGVLYCKNDRTYPYWRAMIPNQLETRMIGYVHMLSGHQGTDKNMRQIAQSFHLRSLGRKVRRYVAHCDTCQRVKHPNRAYEIERVSHLPTKPGELTTVDLYGPLPTGRGGVKYLLVCLEFFSKHVKLYPLKSATTRSCLNKLRNQYLQEVTKPKVILSDHGSQFASPAWQRALADMGIQCKYSPIRHPESNPTERVMRELGKYFKIYCNKTHKKWPELVPYIEKWLNTSVSQSTGYTPVELLFGEPQPNMFQKVLNNNVNQSQGEEPLADKLIRAYARMKIKAEKRNRKRRTGNTKWNPKTGDLVLVKCQTFSEAAQGITAKFQLIYEGPYIISKLISPSIYELSEVTGKIRGIFNKSHMKPYLSANPEDRV